MSQPSPPPPPSLEFFPPSCKTDTLSPVNGDSSAPSPWPRAPSLLFRASTNLSTVRSLSFKDPLVSLCSVTSGWHLSESSSFSGLNNTPPCGRTSRHLRPAYLEWSERVEGGSGKVSARRACRVATCSCAWTQ